MSYIGVVPQSPLAFWQHGFGAYENVGDWAWEYDPFVFSFLAPMDSKPQPAPVIAGFGQAPTPTGKPSLSVTPTSETWTRACPGAYYYANGRCVPIGTGASAAYRAIEGISGLGDCGCGCGGKCGKGVGQAAGGGLFGTGLFSSSDPTQWGWGEWLTIAGTGYVGLSLLGDVKSAGRKAGAGYRAARRA